MSNRSATDTIKGYFYQFDYSIYQLLSAENYNHKITVEGIEDIDVATSTEVTAIQCKYYSKTEYNHSVIAKPIRLMLTHFNDVKKGLKTKVNYRIYGHYKSGHSKLSLPIELSFLKETILTYAHNKIKNEHHTYLGLSDLDLLDFIGLLSIDINARDYDSQFKKIISMLKDEFSCDDFDAEYYYYNNALNEIKKLAVENKTSDREISRSGFVGNINKKSMLFNKWFVEKKGKKLYFKSIKNKYFSSMNQYPYERFFLIDYDAKNKISDLKDLIFFISRKYSRLSSREPNKYCPYIYIHNIDEHELVGLKESLYNEGFKFSDGFPFLGSKYSVSSISQKLTKDNPINAKIICNLSQVKSSLKYISETREIYQFFINEKFFDMDDEYIKHIPIQISEMDNIKEII